MRGLLAALGVALALLAGEIGNAPAAPSCHPSFTDPLLRANLDRDPALEVVTGTNVSCAHEIAFGVTDECRGRRKEHRLPGRGLRNERKVVEANRLADGREFLYILRQPDSAAPELGTAALVHLARIAPGSCPVPRLLFWYQADRPPIPPPRGITLSAFDVEVMELNARYKGMEIRLVELFSGRSTVRRRITLLRYSRGTDRYVIYSSTL